jgi:hypothetical protein
MKKYIYILSFIVGAGLFFVTCKQDELLKDTEVYINTDVLITPLSIRFLDANPQGGAITVPIKIEITGIDKDKIYSVTGKKKALEADAEVFHIGVKRKYAPSFDNPLVFTITAKAEGYMDCVKTFVLNDPNTGFESMKMIKKDNPAKFITVATGTTNTSNVAASDFFIETEAKNSNLEKMSFRIKAGTLFFGGSDGKTPLKGNVTASISYMSGINDAIEELMPGGPDAGTQVFELNAKPKKPSSAAMAGCSIIDVYVDGVKATNFENKAGSPLTTTMTLNAAIENPERNFDPIQKGDSLTVWTMSENSPIWKIEKRTVIQSNSQGVLEATFTHDHLSSFGLGWFLVNGCYLKSYKNGLTGEVSKPDAVRVLTVNSNQTSNAICGTGGTGFYYTEIYTKKKNKKLGSGYFEYYNGRIIPLAILSAGSNESSAIWRVYSGNEVNKKTLLYAQEVQLCSNGTLNIANSLPTSISVGLSISAVCDGLATLIPSAPLEYRESGDNVYRILGYVTSGKGCAGRLEKGKKYDFRLAYGGIEKEMKGLVVPSQDSTVTVSYPNSTQTDVIQWQYQGDKKDQIILNYENISLPDELCDLYKRILKGG